MKRQSDNTRDKDEVDASEGSFKLQPEQLASIRRITDLIGTEKEPQSLMELEFFMARENHFFGVNYDSNRVQSLSNQDILQRIEYRGAIPVIYRCTLSGLIMTHPVFDPRNPEHKFESASIIDYLKKNASHPITSRPLSANNLINDSKLKTKIDKFVNSKRNKTLNLADETSDNETYGCCLGLFR